MIRIDVKKTDIRSEENRTPIIEEEIPLIKIDEEGYYEYKNYPSSKTNSEFLGAGRVQTTQELVYQDEDMKYPPMRFPIRFKFTPGELEGGYVVVCGNLIYRIYEVDPEDEELKNILRSEMLKYVRSWSGYCIMENPDNGTGGNGRYTSISGLTALIDITNKSSEEVDDLMEFYSLGNGYRNVFINERSVSTDNENYEKESHLILVHKPLLSEDLYL